MTVDIAANMKVLHTMDEQIHNIRRLAKEYDVGDGRGKHSDHAEINRLDEAARQVSAHIRELALTMEGS